MKREGKVHGRPSSKSRKARKPRVEGNSCTDMTRPAGSVPLVCKPARKRNECTISRPRKAKDWQASISYLVKEGKTDAYCGPVDYCSTWQRPCRGTAEGDYRLSFSTFQGTSSPWDHELSNCSPPPLVDEEWPPLTASLEKGPKRGKAVVRKVHADGGDIVNSRVAVEPSSGMSKAEDASLTQHQSQRHLHHHSHDEQQQQQCNVQEDAQQDAHLAIINSLTELVARTQPTFSLLSMNFATSALTSSTLGGGPSGGARDDGIFDEISLAASIFATHPEYFRQTPLSPRAARVALDPWGEDDNSQEEEVGGGEREEGACETELGQWEWLPPRHMQDPGSPSASSWSVVGAEDDLFTNLEVQLARL